MHDTLSGTRPLPALICSKMDASVHRTVKSVGRLHLDSRIMGNIIVTRSSQLHEEPWGCSCLDYNRIYGF